MALRVEFYQYDVSSKEKEMLVFASRAAECSRMFILRRRFLNCTTCVPFAFGGVDMKQASGVGQKQRLLSSL